MDVDYDTLYGLMAQQESGNRSYNKDGSLVTSPKGAQGKMQVMPDTNRDPGYGVRPAADDSEEERIRVGRDYFRAMVGVYGDTSKALAAYNFGPGNMDKVLAKHGDQWFDHVPEETQNYVRNIGGQYNGTTSPKLTSAYITSKGKPTFTKALERAQALSDYGTADVSTGGQPNSKFDSRFPVAPDQDVPALYPEDAARINKDNEQVGFNEAFFETMIDQTVTGAVAQVIRSGAPDPTFDAMSEENKNAMINAGVYGIDTLADYVLGSRNAQDFGERLQIAQERKEYMGRLANSGASATAGMLVGGMADPVAVVATVGAGAAVVAIRNAAILSRTAAMGRAALGGAVENVLAGQFVDDANNQRFSWGNLVEQGITGAALGSLGGLFHNVGEAKDASVRTALADAMREVSDRQLNKAVDEADLNTRAPDIDPSLPTEAVDIPNGPVDMAYSLEERRAQRLEQLEQQRADDAQFLRDNVTDPTDIAERRAAREALRDLKQVDEEAAKVRREIREREQATEQNTAKPKTSTVIEDENVKSGWAKLAEIEQTSNDALEVALAARLRNMLVNDVPVRKLTRAEMDAAVGGPSRGVGGFYHSAEGWVGIAPDATNANWVYLHELAHAATLDNFRHGLANPDTQLGKLAREIETLRTRALNKWEATKPKNTDAKIKSTGEAQQLQELVDYYLKNGEEFLAGLYSGNQKFLDLLQGIKLKNESLLTRVVAAVRKVLGLDAGETTAFLKALDLSERISVPHVYPQTPSSLAKLSVQARKSLPLSEREQKVADALDKIGETLDPAAKETVERGQKWLGDRPEFLKKGDTWAFSPGVALSASASRVARIAGSLLFENSLGSSKRTSSVSMNYELMQRGYRDRFLELIQPDLISMMTPGERARYQFWDGSRAALDRISTQVAEERLAHRAAVKAGIEYKSTAPEPIQRIARVMDNQVDKMTKEGVALGNEYADNVRGSGWVGFMPQVWKWEKFAEANRSDPAAWNSLRRNFTQQYIEMNVEPALKKLSDAGALPEEIEAVRARMLEQVEHQVDNRLAESIRDPESRTSFDANKFETMAAQLLTENFDGVNVTRDVASQFRKLLGEHVRDRSRTEFDLLREIDGVRLLDFVEHDVTSTVQHSAHRFAGQNAMAKAGFKDLTDFESLITLAQKDGASTTDIELLQFAGRAYGFLPMKAQDHPMLASLRNFVYAATMGKLGLANLADIAATATAVGMDGMLRTMGRLIGGESDLYKQIATRATGLLGQDYRIHRMTADVLPNGKALTGVGAGVLRVSQKAAQFTSFINGSNLVSKHLHKAFLPVLAEDLVNGIRGKDGGMTARRLADAGLSGDTVARIKAQLDKHEPTRKEGDAFAWDKWDDQEAADRLIEAMHRITYQTFQRTLVGEAPAWRSESAMGSLVGQFHTYGLTATEKQLGRNLAIQDSNAAVGALMSLTWGAFLFYARMENNMLGMSASERREYEKKNYTPVKITQGVLTYANISGIAADLAGAADIFVGNSYQGGNSSIAAFGYLGNVSRAANSAGKIATGDGEGKDTRNIIRVLPGGNWYGTMYLHNQLRE